MIDGRTVVSDGEAGTMVRFDSEQELADFWRRNREQIKRDAERAEEKGELVALESGSQTQFKAESSEEIKRQQELEKQAKAKKVKEQLDWSNETALNGEPFLLDISGNIDLIDIPQSVFDALGIKKVPFRLTPSMVTYVYWRHGKELKLKSPKDALYAILDVMSNFDHVRRQGQIRMYFLLKE